MKDFVSYLIEGAPEPNAGLHRWKDGDYTKEKGVEQNSAIHDEKRYVRHVTPEGHDLRIFRGTRTGLVGTTNGKVTHTAEGTLEAKKKLADQMQNDVKKKPTPPVT